MILAWPLWKITRQAELQLDCWEWGCVLPGCGLRLLQKAAAATAFCTEQLPDSSLTMRSLAVAGKRFPWKNRHFWSWQLSAILLHRFLVANGGESIMLQLRHWRGLQTLTQLPAVTPISWVTQNSLLLNSPWKKLYPSSILPVSHVAKVSPQS